MRIWAATFFRSVLSLWLLAACAKTGRMMTFFSSRIGERYPYEKYDQVFVQDFIFGGMENTTATTLTDTALLDRKSFVDVKMDSLVAHELAHQWWGDLVTCRDWSHGWLNEGFATYFDALWQRILRNDASFVGAHLKLGALYREMGRRVDARRHYQAALAAYRERGREREAEMVQVNLADLEGRARPRYSDAAAPSPPASRPTNH